MNALLPALLLLCLAAGAWKRVPLYDAFLTGAREGLETAKSILPSLLCMLCAVRVFDACGLSRSLCVLLEPLFSWAGLPGEVLPLMLMKPLSGSASLSILRELFSAYGPDSPVGLIASVVMGSSETVFYTCSLYLGAAKVSSSRHILPCGLLAWLSGSLAAGFFAG